MVPTRLAVISLLIVSTASSHPSFAQNSATAAIQHETEFFDLKIFDGLEDALAPLLPQELDACTQETDVLGFRENTSKIPFFVARDYQQLDESLDERFAGKIAFIDDDLIENGTCGSKGTGNLFVSSDTISLCVIDEAFWRDVINSGEFCTYLTHELVHIVQNELADRRPLKAGETVLDRMGPIWLLEGIAMLYSNIVSAGEDQLDITVHLMRREIPPGAPRLSNLENYISRHEHGEMQYLKGFVVANYLLKRSSEAALFDFYSCIGQGTEWQTCFQSTFDLSVDKLYSIPSLR